MHARLALLAVALVLLAPMPAAAQEPGNPAEVKVAEDATGDVAYVTAAGPQDAPDQVHADLDLVALRVVETQQEFTFTVQVRDIRLGQEGAGEDGAVVETVFTHADRQFMVRVFHTIPGVGDFIGAALLYRDAETGPWNELWFRNSAVLDPSAETYTVAVPRSDLADSKGASPFPGRSLEKFSVASTNVFGRGSFIRVAGQSVPSPLTFVDKMPDTGVAAVTVPALYGIKQEGHARLVSEEPFRASNGEATTFIFRAVGINLADEADSFQLRAQKVPQGWSVVLPTPTLELDGTGTEEFPVVVTVPFSHTHGAATSFVLEMASMTDDGTVGRLEMGVRFLAVPQPAGHHNVLYLHSRAYDELSTAFGTVFTGNDGYPFMNTVDEFEGDAGLALTPQSSWWTIENDQPTGIYSWCIPLDPGLQMGLDFSLSGTGRVRIPLHATAPMSDATLYARLLLLPEDSSRFSCYFGGEPRILASLNGTAPAEIGANADGVLEGDLEVWTGADRIPYVKGQNIYLFAEVHAVGAPGFFVAQGQPRLIPGGQLTLPLLEYHDDVKEVINTVRGPALTPLGPQERLANPGDTILFPISVANDGDTASTIGFNLTGPNSAWATLPPGGTILVAAHSTGRADVVVQVPPDAKAGDTADLVLQAYDVDAESGRGLLRLVVTVVTDEEVPSDEAAPQADTPRRSPAWAPIGVLASLGLLACARRRTLG